MPASFPSPLLLANHKDLMNHIDDLAKAKPTHFRDNIHLSGYNLLAIFTGSREAGRSFLDLTFNKTAGFVTRQIFRPVHFIASKDFAQNLEQLPKASDWLLTAKSLCILTLGLFLSLLTALSASARMAQWNAHFQAPNDYKKIATAPVIENKANLSAADKKAAEEAKKRADEKALETLQKQAENLCQIAKGCAQNIEKSLEKNSNISKVLLLIPIMEVDSSVAAAQANEKEALQELAHAESQAALLSSLVKQAKNLDSSALNPIAAKEQEAVAAVTLAKNRAAEVKAATADILMVSTTRKNNHPDFKLESQKQNAEKDIRGLREKILEAKTSISDTCNSTQANLYNDLAELKDCVAQSKEQLKLACSKFASIKLIQLADLQDLADRAKDDLSLRPLFFRVKNLRDNIEQQIKSTEEAVKECKIYYRTTKYRYQLAAGTFPEIATIKQNVQNSLEKINEIKTTISKKDADNKTAYDLLLNEQNIDQNIAHLNRIVDETSVTLLIKEVELEKQKILKNIRYAEFRKDTNNKASSEDVADIKKIYASLDSINF